MLEKKHVLSVLLIALKITDNFRQRWVYIIRLFKLSINQSSSSSLRNLMKINNIRFNLTQLLTSWSIKLVISVMRNRISKIS
jgi:hypothetical protein